MREHQQPRFVMSDQPLETSGPVIETARLRLRRHRLSDLEARIAITGDAHFMRFVGGVYDRQENWSRLLRYIGHWATLGYGLLAVEERAAGHYIGDVGLARFERGLGADFDAAPEAGWMIAQTASGLGYATEGVAAAIDWHERTFGPQRFVCMIDPANHASLRVAAKLGFVPFREALNRGHPVLLHERTPPLPMGRD
jgi:RimJ/RimL family protein N-acetyltransferase